MNKRVIVFAVMALSVLLGGTVKAVFLTFNFSGEVLGVGSDDASGTFGAHFAAGDPFTGKFVIDTTAVPTIFPALNLASYPASFSATISGLNFSGPAEYRIFNDAPGAGDGFSIVNEPGNPGAPYTAPVLGNLVPTTFFLQFLGMPTTTLSDFSLVTDPVSIFPLATTYAPHGLRMDDPTDGTYATLGFRVDTLSVATPEAGGLSLFGLGLFALMCFRNASLIASRRWLAAA